MVFSLKMEAIANLLKITHFPPPPKKNKRAKIRFILTKTARQNDQSRFQYNSEPRNANNEVLRSKQLLNINFSCLFLKNSLKAQNVFF